MCEHRALNFRLSSTEAKLHSFVDIHKYEILHFFSLSCARSTSMSDSRYSAEKESVGTFRQQ